MASAECRMWSRYAACLSCIYLARGFENRALPYRIVALLNRPPRQNIDGAAKDLLQFVLHDEELESRFDARPKSNQQIQIAARQRLPSCHRAEHFDARNTVTPAELGNAPGYLVNRRRRNRSVHWARHLAQG